MSFVASSLTNIFQPINPGGITAPCFLLRIVNDSAVGVYISYDGVIDNDYIPPKTSLEVPGSWGWQEMGTMGTWRKGTIVYVSGSAGARDSFIHLLGYYLTA